MITMGESQNVLAMRAFPSFIVVHPDVCLGFISINFIDRIKH